MTPEKANELLIGCREEGVKLSKEGELREAGYGKQENHKVSKKIRCDTLMWLTPLLKQSQENDDTSKDEIRSLRELVHKTTQIKDMVNDISPKVNPNANRRIRLDGEEI